LRATGVVLVVTGVGLVVGGAALTVLAQQAFKEIDQPAHGYVFNPDTENHLHVYRPTGAVLLGVGGAALVGGIAAFAAGARGNRPAVTVIPSLGTASAGLVATGGFWCNPLASCPYWRSR